MIHRTRRSIYYVSDRSSISLGHRHTSYDRVEAIRSGRPGRTYDRSFSSERLFHRLPCKTCLLGFHARASPSHHPRSVVPNSNRQTSRSTHSAGDTGVTVLADRDVVVRDKIFFFIYLFNTILFKICIHSVYDK